MHDRGDSWWGDVCDREECVAGGACVTEEERAWQGGMHVMHAPRTLPDMVGQCVGGTHPTGMHSCIFNHFH